MRRYWKGMLIGFMALIIVLLGAGYYLLHTYTITDENAFVEGNVHYTDDEIRAFVMEGPLGHNSLYLSLKYKNTGVENIPFVDAMDVEIMSTDSIKITVYEKALAGYVEFMDTYLYFDKDGFVVESSNVKTYGIPQIAGLQYDYATLGQKLPVENESVFSTIMSITNLLDKYDLTVDKIYFQNDTDITLFFGNIRVALGEGGNLEEKLMVLPTFLADLEGQKGVLRMESYSEDTHMTVFETDE